MILFELLQSRWVQRAVEIGVLLLALFFVRQHFLDEGAARGRAQAGAQTTAQIEQQRALDRVAAVQAIDAAQEQAAASEARYQAAVLSESRHLDALQHVLDQQSIAQNQLARVPNSGLHGFITGKLGRPTLDLTPGYTVDEERQLAGCLVNQPACESRAQELTGQLADLKGERAALNDRVASGDSERAALSGYAHQLEQDYALVYNALPRKRNLLVTIVTLGLRGKPKLLKAPDPKDLHP